ncbi:MAG: protein-L-isoaspartate(D-aspartate) O-methyltransferase [Anaerolineae bacterium]|jgi:protein-L-isoaspartate(D-aspartate) O-methyltransferase
MFDRFFRASVPTDMTFEEQRRWMVEHQLIDWGIHDPRVLEVMGRIPREHFVPASQRDMAYYDGALPIGQGQTISQPFVVAHMTELLELAGDEKVLEIGTGSGYQTAVLSRLAQDVFTMERLDELAQAAKTRLDALDVSNVHYGVGDGSLGWPEHAPYDGILVACAAPQVPPPLVDQLADGGRLVVPIGPRGMQDLILVRKAGDDLTQEKRSPVAFVPMIGEHAW